MSIIMEKLLDNLNEYIPKIEKLIIEKENKIRRKEPVIHRWWSRRFIYLYRSILSAFLLETNDKFFESIENPELLDAKGQVYLEPMAGGGTGIVEASLYNYNAYGIDINPLAVKIIKGYSILRNNVDFDKIISVIEEVKNELNQIWTYNGQEVSYVFFTKEKVPSWIMTYGKKKVILCPNCGRTFETENTKEVNCPYCNYNIEITIRPIYGPKNYVTDSEWKIFGFITNKKFIFDRDWLDKRIKLINEIPHIEIDVNIEQIKEGKRLLKAGISRPEQLFTKAQLLTFQKIVEKSKKLNNNERLLLMLAVSDSVKTCSILSKWHPKQNEPVPFAGGLKAYWVPKYHVETNPLALHARSSIFLNINRQQIMKNYEFRGEINVIHGDVLIVNYPKSDLIILDPPYYGLAPSYSSLSFPHIVIINMFEKIQLRESLEKEIRNIKYFEKLLKILTKSKEALKENGRIVLMINMKSKENKLDEIIEMSKLNIINRYEILGEFPGELGRSNNRKIKLIILGK